MANAWKITAAHLVGAQPIDETSTTQKYPLGTIITAASDTLGGGEFIYLEGVANTTVGNVVTYDAATFQTALASIAVGIARPLAVAMSACVADQYGWYQIAGQATVKKASATTFATAAAFGATSGLAVAAVSGLRVYNGVAVVATTAGTTSARMMINRPSGPGEQ
jgi:hypothetical protein